MIVKYLASDCIVSGEVGFLKNLLETLSADTISEQIENWENEGSVYLGYFNAQILITQLKDKIEVILTNFVKDLILFFCNQTWNLFSLFLYRMMRKWVITKKWSSLMRLVHNLLV